jgi:hypothetical protein
MKTNEIVDVVIEYADKPLIVELPNGVQMATVGYTHGTNKKGEPVLIINTGRKLTG